MIWDIPISICEVLNKEIVTADDVVVIQKSFGTNTTTLLSMLKERRIPTIFVDCDLPLKLAEASLASRLICPSQYLTDLYRAKGIFHAHTVPEMYEACRAPEHPRCTRQLKLVWFGCMDAKKAEDLKAFRSLVSEHFPAYEFLVVSNRSADRTWSLDSVWDAVVSCDVVVIPDVPNVRSNIKSANRVVQAMALGMPVIASSFSSYKLLIRNGRNALICTTESEWLEALKEIRDGGLRQRLSSTGFRYARRYFSRDKIGQVWLMHINEISNTNSLSGTKSILTDAERRILLKLQANALGDIASDLRPAVTLHKAYSRERVTKLIKWRACVILDHVRSLMKN